jgi:hypothetical protein
VTVAAAANVALLVVEPYLLTAGGGSEGSIGAGELSVDLELLPRLSRFVSEASAGVGVCRVGVVVAT